MTSSGGLAEAELLDVEDCDEILELGELENLRAGPLKLEDVVDSEEVLGSKRWGSESAEEVCDAEVAARAALSLPSEGGEGDAGGSRAPCSEAEEERARIAARLLLTTPLSNNAGWSPGVEDATPSALPHPQLATPSQGASPSSPSSGGLHTRTRTTSLFRSYCRDLSNLDLASPEVAAEGVRFTPNDLHQATLRSDPELVRKIIGTGTSVNVPIWTNDPDGDIFVTLLHGLAGRPDLPDGVEVLREVARGKANLNARSSLGSTPLARACLHKFIRAAELLLELGADPKPMDDRGRSALHCAVSLEIDCAPLTASNVESISGGLVSLLAAKGADLECGDPAPPLLEAVRQANRPAVTALLSHGAKPKFLHAAVDQAPAAVVEDLLKGNANPFEEDLEGKTVLDIAFRRGDEEITTLLRDFIGDLERRNHSSGMAERAGVSHWESQSNPPGPHDSQEEDNTLGFSPDFARKRGRKLSRSDTDDSGLGGKRKSPRRFSIAGNGLLNRQRRVGGKADKLDTLKEWSAVRKCFAPRWARFQVFCRRLNRNRNFQLVMFAALLAVLFFPDLWILCDVEDNTGLDVILLTVLAFFIIELVVQTIGMPKTYINSFFFWMDIVGLLSVSMDLSLVSNSLPRSLENAVVMRAARTARLGARAGRFTKLVKLLRFLPGVHEETQGSQGTAKTMSTALITSLSTRVACLIIVMVMVLPLFEMTTYPENDYSMMAWMNLLDYTLERYGGNATEIRVAEFASFYSDKDYFPFEVSWRAANGDSGNLRLDRIKPRRADNEVPFGSDSGRVASTFNFGQKKRVDALCNISLIVVIIILMMGFSLLLSNSVSAIVLQPLENLLMGVKQMASKIFTSVTTMAAKCISNPGEEADGQGEDFGEFGNETELLEKVIDKLATLSAITMKTSPIDAATLAQMGESDRAVLAGFSYDQIPAKASGPRKSAASFTSSSSALSTSKRDDHTEELVQTLETYLEHAGVAWGTVDSWEFNTLEIEEQQRHVICLCFIVFHLGLSYNSKQRSTLVAFIDTAAAGYGNPLKIPYHNWNHAIDVTHCVFRLLNLCATERFLGNYERFALVIGAVCHDIGHPGMNNPFLVETAHELAIRYNDHSPLENMHCAKLFEIVKQPKTAVFAMLDRSQYREVRLICIEAILHTDNIHHFAMVKELQMLYEMNSDMFDFAFQMYQQSQLDFPPREICDLFMEPENKKLMRNLLLHFSDISNPTKPFKICQRWAWLIIDEFFIQGDREKELGMAVQPLNDRDKVNKPYSQVGFIEFFIAPFAFATVRLLPPLVACTDRMMLNLNSWCEEWLTTTVPPPDAEDVCKLQERIVKLEAKFIFRDGF